MKLHPIWSADNMLIYPKRPLICAHLVVLNMLKHASWNIFVHVVSF